MTVAATEIQDDIPGPRPGYASHKRKSVFEQPLRMTVLFRKSG